MFNLFTKVEKLILRTNAEIFILPTSAGKLNSLASVEKLILRTSTEIWFYPLMLGRLICSLVWKS